MAYQKITACDKYMDALRSGYRSSVSGLCGRILRGKSADDFVTLTNDPNRKIVFLMGEDGLERLLGLSGRQMLEACGYSSEDISYFAGQGLQFKLVVFRTGNSALPARWVNIARSASAVYPEVAQHLRRQTKQLATISYDELQQLAGYNFAEVAAKGAADPRYMTFERYRESEKTPADTRAFYEHTLHVRRLFKGDGYAYDEDNNRGVREYCAINVPLSELTDSCLQDITIAT